MVPQIDCVEAVECDSEHEAAWLERNLIEQSKPRWNRAIGGLEVEVYIGLHRRLDVRHEQVGPGLLFGPYLGGEKVRLGISGLHRVIPLAYAGERLSGSDRDMARVLGVEPGSHADLIAAASAVLNRDPEAATRVRLELQARRDAAATALAYELAARIHAELDGLEWVVAEQKVTRLDPGSDLDVHGWADGILISLNMRNGRIRVWSQRPCDANEAKSKVDATPVEWRAFAQRNAALAARLGAS